MPPNCQTLHFWTNPNPALTIILLSSFFFLTPCEAKAAGSVDCGNQIARLGDTQLEVEEICGPPAFLDSYEEHRLIRKYRRKELDLDEKNKREADHQNDHADEERHLLINERAFLIDFDEWTYNFGPNRFIQTLIFKNNRLVSIKGGSYGFDTTPNFNLLTSEGDSKAIVWMKYGKPRDTSKSTEFEVSVSRSQQGGFIVVEEVSRPLVIEKWIYDFGPNKYLEEFTFDDGRLANKRTLKSKGARILAEK